MKVFNKKPKEPIIRPRGESERERWYDADIVLP